jgi:sec-independent protein translocase protein TatA
MMSPMHWIIVILVVLLVFGAGRLGEVGKGLGDGIRNFKKGLASEGDEEANADPKQLKDQKPTDTPAQPEEKKEKV